MKGNESHNKARTLDESCERNSRGNLLAVVHDKRFPPIIPRERMEHKAARIVTRVSVKKQSQVTYALFEKYAKCDNMYLDNYKVSKLQRLKQAQDRHTALEIHCSIQHLRISLA